MTFWKKAPTLIATLFLMTGCQSHSPQNVGAAQDYISEHIEAISETSERPPQKLAAISAQIVEPHIPEATCVVLKGVPEEGLGVYNKSSDVMDIDLTYKPTALNCYDETTRSQSCRLDAGGFITWVEYGQRRHIKAQGGLVDVTLWHQQGARCNA